MKYRIKIELVEGRKYTHVHNIMCESDNLKELIRKIRHSIMTEIDNRLGKLMEHLSLKSKDYIDNLISEIDYDLIDWKSKGKDISKREYLENEIS